MADRDVRGGADPHAGADQRIIPDDNAAASGQGRPDGEADLPVGRCDDVGVPAEDDRTAEDLDVPRLEKQRPLPQLLELGTEEAVGVPSLEPHAEALDEVRPVIPSHESSRPPEFAPKQPPRRRQIVQRIVRQENRRRRPGR